MKNCDSTRPIYCLPVYQLSPFQTSQFIIEAVILGRLRRLSVWLEPNRSGDFDDETEHWYLEKILVQELRTTSRLTDCTKERSVNAAENARGWSCFPCYQWIRTGTRPGSPQFQLIASAGSGNLSLELIETTSLINQEEVWVSWSYQTCGCNSCNQCVPFRARCIESTYKVLWFIFKPFYGKTSNY